MDSLLFRRFDLLHLDLDRLAAEFLLETVHFSSRVDVDPLAARLGVVRRLHGKLHRRLFLGKCAAGCLRWCPAGPAPRRRTASPVDNEGSAAGAARHLIGLGHRTLGVVTWRLHSDGFTGWADAARQASARYEVFRLRLRGYQRAAAEAGLPPGAVRVWEQPGHSVADGCAAGRALLSLPVAERPAAVLASTDVLALGVLQAARELGLHVPRDLSVTGYDDIDESGRGHPPLTTVHQDLYQQGQDCARRLISPGSATTLLHPTRLVVRDSTAARRGRRDHHAGTPVRPADDLRVAAPAAADLAARPR